MGSACAMANNKQQHQIPKIQVMEQEEDPHDNVHKHSSESKRTEMNTTKVSGFSKQVSNISSDVGQPKKTLIHRTTLNQEEIQKRITITTNPGKDHLVKQREFILEKFQSDLKVVEKTIMSDIVQMLRTFLSHLESSPIYWTKVWLVSKNDNSIVVAYVNNVCETRKVRILFTKQIELMSNLLDNYSKYQQFNFYKIYDYHFRFNRRYLNFYVFSEQEYCETCLDQYTIELSDIKPLLKYLISVVTEMHKQNYVHAGIKPSNVYMYVDQECKIRFKLDISFQAFKFTRRNQKSKELRLNQINDLEDIAILIINLFYKGTEVRQQLKQKSLDFSSIVNSLYQGRQEYVESYIKDVMTLLHRNKQYLFDLAAADYATMLTAQSCLNVPELVNTEQILFHYVDNLVCFYTMTSIRSQKALTQYLLITPDGDAATIIPNSIYIQDNQLYFAYQDMIGMIDIKLSNESIEDTIEILQLALKQILAGIEKKRERTDSAQPNYQLQINHNSPTIQIGDKFEFNNAAQAKNVNRSFHDRTYFTQNNLQELFQMIDTNAKDYFNADQLYEFLQKYSEFVDNSLLQMLPLEKLYELITFFADKQMTVREFPQIFRFRCKSQLPTYFKVVKPLKCAQSVQAFSIFNNSVVYYDGTQLHTDTDSKELDFPLIKLVRSDNSVMLIGRKDKCLYLNNLQNCSTLTRIPVPDEVFGFQKLGNLFAIIMMNKLTLYSVKQDRQFDFEIPGMTPASNLIVKDCMIVFMNREYVFKIFISQDKYALVKSDINATLKELGRLDSKIKVKIQTKQSTGEDLVGSYTVTKVLYPLQTQAICQFRVLQVFKDQRYILVQRIVHGEIESFDDCYSVCKYFDQKLVDFFLTQEFDGRVRLNYVLPDGEPLEAKNCTWIVIKRAMKELYKMRMNGIFISEMHPNNMIIYQDRVQFTTLIYKSNIPSIFSDRLVPIVGSLEYLEPKTFQGATQNFYQNQIYTNPNKSNVYNFGLIMLRFLSTYQINNTKEQQLYLMEIAQALQQLNCTPAIKSIIEEMLKENEEHRQDSLGILNYIRRTEQKIIRDIYFPPQLQQLNLLDHVSTHQYAFHDNILYNYQNDEMDVQHNFLQQSAQVLSIQALDHNMLLMLLKLKTFDYRLLYIRVGLVRSNSKEMVNFQQYAENDDDDYQNQLTNFNNVGWVKPPNELIKEVDLPIFELQDVDTCTTYQSAEDTYIFGAKLVGNQYANINDTYIYLQRRQIAKKLSMRNTYFDSTVFDFPEHFLLFERQISNKIRCQIIHKNPFLCQDRYITLQNTIAIELTYFKTQGQILGFSPKLMLGWLINTDSLKALKLRTETTIQSIQNIPMQTQGNMQMIVGEQVLHIQIVENSVLRIAY